MKTAQSIEKAEERKKQLAALQRPDGSYPNGKNPASHTPRGFTNHAKHVNPALWKPGQSGNPSGRISDKKDIAKQIARAVFENNQEELYKAFASAALKGNAYAFSQLADRAYGKLKERVEYDVTEYREVSEKAIIERIAELENQLGIARQIDDIGRAEPVETRALPPSGKTQD